MGKRPRHIPSNRRFVGSFLLFVRDLGVIFTNHRDIGFDRMSGRALFALESSVGSIGKNWRSAGATEASSVRQFISAFSTIHC